jgi:hypothetical protein
MVMVLAPGLIRLGAFRMPPPLMVALFPLTVDFAMDMVAELFVIPPPQTAWFPLTVVFMIVTLPT